MAAGKPSVLVLDEEIPVPANTGKRIRTLSLLSRLADRFEIQLLVHSGGADPAAIATLAARGIRVHTAPSRIPAKSGLGFAGRLLGSLLFTGLPYSVASHRRKPYADRLRALLETSGFSLVHCEWTPYAAYLARPPVPWVVSAHNLETRIWERLAATASRAPERWVFRSQAARMDRFERGVFARADAVTAVSGGDAAAIRARGATLVEVVANGVDLRYFTPRPGEEEPDTLAFTGSMDWRPNQEGVRWFAERVHPRLREKRAYTLLAVGRRPPGWMTRPGGLPPNIRVTGTVEDVRPYIARGEVYVAPLLAGGGSRLKILEALAMGRAVVSTTVGAEGLDVVADRDLVLADDPGAFADAVVELLYDAPRRRALGEAGRKLVESRYDWDVIAEVQARLWTRLIEGEAAPIGTTT